MVQDSGADLEVSPPTLNTRQRVPRLRRAGLSTTLTFLELPKVFSAISIVGLADYTQAEPTAEALWGAFLGVNGSTGLAVSSFIDVRISGWGGRIRTYDAQYQKLVPYHLATPQL